MLFYIARFKTLELKTVCGLFFLNFLKFCNTGAILNERQSYLFFLFFKFVAIKILDCSWKQESRRTHHFNWASIAIIFSNPAHSPSPRSAVISKWSYYFFSNNRKPSLPTENSMSMNGNDIPVTLRFGLCARTGQRGINCESSEVY